METVVPVIISYIIGSISFSFVIAKLIKGIDIRQHGSGNAGATNTLRVLGKGPGILVLILDILKGVAAVGLAYWMAPDNELVAAICGLVVVVGHNWPIFTRFKGGKGIATTIGAGLTLWFFPMLYAVIVTIVIIALTRYVSVGSLVMVTILPVFVYVNGSSWQVLLVVCLLTVLGWFQHRTNIVKLLKGQENRLGAGKRGM